MANVFETLQTAGRVYADAILALATEQNCIDEVSEQLADLMKLWREQKSFAQLMTTASIDDAARHESLKKIFKGRVHPLVMNLLLVLNQKDRTLLLPAICDAYRRAVDEKLGRKQAYVTTAVPLDDAQRKQLCDEARRLCNREPVLVETVDPGVLGGARLQVGDRLVDRTLALRLRQLRRELGQRFDKHLHEGTHKFVTE